jgi:hypothetical protein
MDTTVARLEARQPQPEHARLYGNRLKAVKPTRNRTVTNSPIHCQARTGVFPSLRALIGPTTHRGVQAEAGSVGAQTEGAAVSARDRLQ